MKQYKIPEIEITVVALCDVVTASSFAVKDKGKDTPWVGER